MPRLATCGATASALILFAAITATLAPPEAVAQSPAMSERHYVQRMTDRLDRIRRKASQMEKVVAKDWEPVSKAKEDRYRNAMHKQLDELQKKARTEKRRLNSNSGGMFETRQERAMDYRSLEYTVDQMERQLAALERQMTKFEERRQAGDN